MKTDKEYKDFINDMFEKFKFIYNFSPKLKYTKNIDTDIVYKMGYKISTNTILVDIKRLKKLKLSDSIIGKIKSKKEYVTKMLLHEYRHSIQNNLNLFPGIHKFPVYRLISMSVKEYNNLPWEKDANKFAIDEWDSLWIFIVNRQ